MGRAAKCFTTVVELIENSETENCIEFRHGINKSGYSRLTTREGHHVFAHRFVYCWVNDVPKEDIKGYAIMHSCDNRLCINPKHLQKGTWADNNKDRAEKGRSAANVHSRRHLTEDQVREIRKRYSPIPWLKSGCRTLADEFGVERSTIMSIIKRETYRDIF